MDQAALSSGQRRDVAKKEIASIFAISLALSVVLPVAAVSAPGSEELLLEHANNWREQNRPDLSADALNQVLALDAGQPDALYQLGMLAMEQGDLKKAQQYFDRLRRHALADKHQIAPKRAIAQTTAAQPVPAVMTVANVSGASTDVSTPQTLLAQAPPPPSTAPPVFVAPPPPPPPPQPIADQFSLSPRTWYLFEDRQLFQAGFQPITTNLAVPSATRTSGSLSRTFTFNQPSTPMGGGALTYAPWRLPDTNFTLSYLRGTSTFGGSFTDFITGPGVFSGGGMTAGGVNHITTHYTRNDIELLSQTRFTHPDLTNLSWFFGFRAELSDFDQDIQNVMKTDVPYTQHVTYNFYSGKAGIGFVLPFAPASNHSIFGNFLGVFGVNDVSASNVPVSNSCPGNTFNANGQCAGMTSLVFGGTSYTSFRIGNDFAIGYRYDYSDTLSFDARYRVLASYIFATPTTQIFGPQRDRFYVQHGPMLELTWRF